MQKAREINTNRRIVAELIFGGNNEVAEATKVAKARAAKKNAEPRRGSDEHMAKQVLSLNAP